MLILSYTLSSMKAVEAVVFDLDGTLIVSSHDYPEMARMAEEILRDAGVPDEVFSKPRLVWDIVRGGVNSLKELGFSPDMVKRTIGLINEALNKVELQSLDSVEPMPGGHETLQTLRQRGIKIGIATRSCGAYARESLKMASLEDYVDALLARDEVENPKPDPRHLLQVVTALGASPQEVVYVGDTTTDHKTATEAGIAFIGFPRTEEWRRRLKEAGCSIFIADIREIIGIIDNGLLLPQESDV